MKLSNQALNQLIASGRLPAELRQQLSQQASQSPHKQALGQLRAKPQLYQGQMEYFDQIILLHWLDLYRPDLYELCYAVPNGGMRTAAVAGQMKATGQKSGYPDLGLDLARGRYHGLRIELKRSDGTGKASVSQKQWQHRLEHAGYCYALCHGYAMAISVITAYADLGLGQFNGQDSLDLNQLPAYPLMFDPKSLQFFGVKNSGQA